jgi:hypothetical protein
MDLHVCKTSSLDIRQTVFAIFGIVPFYCFSFWFKVLSKRNNDKNSF